MEQFTQQLTELLKEILGENYEISQTEVTKINDCKHPTLVNREKDSSIGANIYLDDYYEAYKKGNLQFKIENKLRFNLCVGALFCGKKVVFVIK